MNNKLGLILLLPTVAFANPIEVDVSNLEKGTPCAKMHVSLEAQQNNTWVEIGQGETDDKGHLAQLYPQTKTTLDKGIYKVTFKTGDWYKSQNQRSFYTEIPVVFVIDNAQTNYRIPLQISPYGYSTYKGISQF